MPHHWFLKKSNLFLEISWCVAHFLTPFSILGDFVLGWCSTVLDFSPNGWLSVELPEESSQFLSNLDLKILAFCPLLLEQSQSLYKVGIQVLLCWDLGWIWSLRLSGSEWVQPSSCLFAPGWSVGGYAAWRRSKCWISIQEWILSWYILLFFCWISGLSAGLIAYIHQILLMFLHMNSNSSSL